MPVLHGVDALPSYLIVGGLVFTPLSSPFLEVCVWGAHGAAGGDYAGTQSHSSSHCAHAAGM